jgi:protein SCO1/2
MTTERFRVCLSVVYYIAFFAAGGCRPSEKPSRPLPAFSLTAVDARGETHPLTRDALLGRPWVADFVYTRCAGPCPLLSGRLAALRAKLPAGFGLLSFTVDPDHDSPAVLAEYAARYKAGPEWLFVTGDKAAMTALIKEGFLLPVAEDAKAAPGERVAHSAKFALIDREAQVRGWYDGDDDASLDLLAADARTLAGGASRTLWAVGAWLGVMGAFLAIRLRARGNA